MANEFWSKAHCYQQWAEESVAMANLATSNRTRAELYAAAEYYLYLSKVEGNLAKKLIGSSSSQAPPPNPARLWISPTCAGKACTI